MKKIFLYIFMSVSSFICANLLLETEFVLRALYILILMFIGAFTSAKSIVELLKYLYEQEISIILKKIDTDYFKRINISLLFKKDKEEIYKSLNVIKEINKEEPKWFIEGVSKKYELKKYLLSKKSFIEYLSSFDNATIEKYFKKDLEDLKYNYKKESDYFYFKELIENRFNKKIIKIEQKIKILSI